MTTKVLLSVTKILLAMLVIATGAVAQKLTKNEQEILWHQDQRSLGDSALVRFLKHKEARIRARSAIALGNIQDTATIPFLLPLLSDRYSDVRAATAFALGQIGSPATEDVLAERLRMEDNSKVIVRLLEALGKSGSIKAYDDVVAFGLPKRLNMLKADQALSIARFAIRSLKSERGVWLCFDMLEEKDSRAQWMALYALWRIAPHGAIDVEFAKRKNQLLALAADRSADIRMHLATLTGKVRTDESFEVLRMILQNESLKGRRDWRVRVNVARALALHASRTESAVDGLLGLLNISNDHVQIAGLTSLAGVSRETIRKYGKREDLKKKLLQMASPSKTRPHAVQGEAFVTLARHYPADFLPARIVKDPSASNLLRSKALEALCQVSSGENLQIALERLDDDSVRVAMAAWDFIRQLLAPQSFRILRKDTAVTNGLSSALFRKAKESLLREDMAITNLVAAALGDSSIHAILRANGYDERALEELMLAYGKLSAPNDVETMQAVLEALGKIGDERTIPVLERALADPDRTVGLAAAAALKKITGSDFADQVVPSTRPLYTDYDWKIFDAIPKLLQVEIKTNKGTIVISLLKEHAPFTVLSFYRLIRKKFFDGLTFHRVVPNFVVQGGDPRGDGWGGPNYAVRTEASMIGYERGM
ncbi:MAG: HEAT repeat domain-containing protein, partial [Bacteroidota bacterium]